MMSNDDKLTRVFAGEYWKASMIMQMLQDNGIAAVLNNQYLSTVAPYISAPGGTPNVLVLVNEADEEQSLKLIDEFESGAENDELSD